MNHKVLKLMLLLATVGILARCAGEVDDTMVGVGEGPATEDDSHGWGTSIQNAGKK